MIDAGQVPFACFAFHRQEQVVDAGVRCGEKLVRPTLERMQRREWRPERCSGCILITAE